MLLILQRRPLNHSLISISSLSSNAINSARHASTRQPKKLEAEPLPPPADGQLPPPEEWKARFWHKNLKPTLYNLQTARELVKKFGIADSKSPKVVLEAFAGPGTLSRALCELPPSKLGKLIILEDNPLYLPYLESLAARDSRVIVRPYDGWYWSSYTQITQEGLLDDIEIANWDNSLKQAHPPHPKLHFIASTLPWGEAGEALFNQMFRAVASREWLFKYGAVPFSAVLPYSFWKRAVAPIGKTARCKLTCMVEATTVAEQALPLKALEKHAQHFFPPQTRASDYMLAANFKPLGHQVMRVAGVAEWDFVLRALFVNKKTPISKTLKTMSPGATNLLNYINPNKMDVLQKEPTQMTLEDWEVFMDAFKSWPLHPTENTLQESVKMTDKRI